MKELPKEKYRDIRHLFNELYYLNRIRSHLERTPISKKVYVNDEEEPKSAVIYVKPRFFLGGKADNKEFNGNLSNLINNEIIPELKKTKFPEISFNFTNETWKSTLESILEDIFHYNRFYYEIRELKNRKWRDSIPEGYSLEPVDLSLLKKRHLLNYDWLMEEIEENWKPFEKGLQEIRGFYLVRNNEEIVAWCTTEYLTDANEIEVGIATKEAYQRKGFAFIVGSATAEYCIPKYKSVGWHCASTNIGSFKTAEKIGYEKKEEYIQIGYIINYVDALIVKGYDFFIKKNFEEAFRFFTQVLERSESPDEEFETSWYLNEGGFTFDRFLFRMASICAGMKEKEKTFVFLNKAIKEGFDDLEHLHNDELLSCFQDTDEWREIIQIMESK